MVKPYSAIIDQGNASLCYIEFPQENIFAIGQQHALAGTLFNGEMTEADIQLDIPGWLRTKLNDTNNRLSLQKAACTLDILIIEEDYAVTGHIGNGRVYGVRSSGEVVQLTKDYALPAAGLFGTAPYLGIDANANTIPPDIFKEIIDQNITSIALREYLFFFATVGDLHHKVSNHKLQAVFDKYADHPQQVLSTLTHKYQHAANRNKNRNRNNTAMLLLDLRKDMKDVITQETVLRLGDLLEQSEAENGTLLTVLGDAYDEIDLQKNLIATRRAQADELEQRLRAVQDANQSLQTQVGTLTSEYEKNIQNLTDELSLRMDNELGRFESKLKTLSAEHSRTRQHLAHKIEQVQQLTNQNTFLRDTRLLALAGLLVGAIATYYCSP